MDEVPESPDPTLQDAQIIDNFHPETGTLAQISFKQLDVPMEPVSPQSPQSAFKQPKFEDDGSRKDECSNDATSSRVLSQEISSSNGIDCGKNDTDSKSESEPESAHFLIEDWVTASQHNHTELESDGLFSAADGLTSLRGPAMTRQTSHSLDATLTDMTDDWGKTPWNEAETILWRHDPFYIVRSPNQDAPNVPMARIMVSPTKGNEASDRELAFPFIDLSESYGFRGFRELFVLHHNPNQLFDILGYLFALAIHNDIFDSGLRDVEEIYQIEIPPQMSFVRLKLRETKVDLPIFRRPGCQTYQSRNTMTTPRDSYSEAGRRPTASRQDNEFYFEYPRVPVFATRGSRDSVSAGNRDAFLRWQGEGKKVDREGRKEKIRQTSRIAKRKKRTASLSELRKSS